MGKDTKIEWADHTFNPWRGCSKVSEACRNCYAETQAKRNPGVLGIWGDNGTRVVASEATWREPLKWDREAKAAGVRRRVFCASMADVFEDWTGPLLNSEAEHLWWDTDDEGRSVWATESGRDPQPVTMADVRTRLFALIDATPNLDWLLLTKRPENIAAMMPPTGCGSQSCRISRDKGGQLNNGPCRCGQSRRYLVPSNVWLGTTVENQQAADERIPHLLRVPAAVRFLSCEPLLGPVDLTNFFSHWYYECLKCGASGTSEEKPGNPCGCFDELRNVECDGHLMTTKEMDRIHWVIAGGESGPHARPSHPDWFRSLRDQCQAAGVPFFMKQWGCWEPVTPLYDGRDDTLEDGTEIVVQRDGVWNCRDGQPTDKRAWLMRHVGKAAAGRMLDGREWNEVPA